LVVPLAGRLVATWDSREQYRLLDAVAWLLRQPEDAITIQELAGPCRSASRAPAGG
jgi:hypothetical protein